MTLLNRILSALLALALLLGGLLAAVEIVVAGLGHDPWLVPHRDWSASLNQQTWQSAPVRATLVVAVLLGIVLLVIAGRRGKPDQVALAGGTSSGVHVSASRRGIERTLEQVVREVEGVVSAKAAAGRHRVRVTVTSARPSSRLASDVDAAVTGRLDALGLTDTLRSQVKLTGQERR